METSSAFVTETRSIPVRGDYDVIVVGGGVAGVSAAVAARRSGMSVLLIEKGVILGGLATMGLVVWYNPPLDDSRGRRLVGGMSRELLHRSVRYGYGTLSPYWEQETPEATVPPTGRYQTLFSAPAFVVALDELIQDEGVDLLFDTLFCAPVMENGWCTGVLVEGKCGRSCYRGRVFIDASGDADLMSRFGASCVEEDNWLSYWAQATSLTAQAKAASAGDVAKSVQPLCLGAFADGTGHPEGMGVLRGLRSEDVTRFLLEGRKMLREHLAKSDKKETTVVTLPSMAQYRTTRHIVGQYTLSDEDKDARFDDSIGCFAEEGPASFVMEFPYRILVSETAPNVLAAGRIASGSGYGRYLCRLIAPSAMTGEAAGRAASLAVKHSCAVQEIPVRELQEQMGSAGYVIHA